ncbi:hypothetical protein GCL60_06970 [Silvanigrella paludirubra]|jgi:hypothetical protein|uniref:PilZ domain-containing protein n=1 Tax=Silvanigrella paludirubra TaxID=2499159 RepID=A0A6N6VW65_9BACT|nr:PilZ domain-containing protein [Silvanigrella paludirubra]KAB8039999.1 hypothetical protein GCL60_06970 [Silvanigrella paludirubra]
MSLSDNNDEKRQFERYKSSIPVIIQKKGNIGTCECTLLDVSLNGFSVRLESGKFKIDVDDNFLLIIDPKLFDIEINDKIIINSICKRIDLETLIIGSVFYKNTESIDNYIKIIVNSFKKINENDY